jgi:carbon starvation protein
MTAMPVMIAVLCVMAIAYRYYSAFLAAKVVALDGTRETPAYQFNDGQNYHPTNKWVLFGHHFAAISGAGPLIGPVLAAQYGYLPGLLWIVIGVCLAGAVQDFIVLAASLRRGGRSLAQIAHSDIGPIAGWASTIAILFIIVIALAGLGKVVVMALGGEQVKYPAGSVVHLPEGAPPPVADANGLIHVPAHSTLSWNGGKSSMAIGEEFVLKLPPSETAAVSASSIELRPGSVRLNPGSSWGTFTITCTIPIALLVGLWMYKIRPGRIVEASVIGAVLTLGVTVLGGLIPGSPLEQFFNLKDTTVVLAMAAYGFVASVLPVWVLLCPRDYLSSFLKIGTIAVLVGGVIIANPKLEAPAVQGIFLSGGPTVPGKIFPYLFIVIMCGAISGFHALVSSGTTPKMIKSERDARTIGYGAMLIEGLVGVCAMIAATTLPPADFYAMNTGLADVPAYQDRFAQIGADIDHLAVYEQRTQESLRGRTGGAVTLAVGMAHIFDGIPRKLGMATDEFLNKLWSYWYHFAIMFEALFILTTIDTGTRIGRFLLQEVMGKALGGRWGRTDFWASSMISTFIIVAGWTYFINANSMTAIWPMFGVANQMLAVIALAVASVYLANIGKARYLWVTVLPMIFVMATTSSAAVPMFIGQLDTFRTQLSNGDARNWTTMFNSLVQGTLILAMLVCGIIVILLGAAKILGIRPGSASGLEPAVVGK